jgi:HD-GYP domain-containing protein (c-di-GMP phosphodiesterase class II)
MSAWTARANPRGCGETKIPLQARIIAVADAFEAMTASRPYQKTKTTDEAKDELRHNAGTQLILKSWRLSSTAY